MRMEIIGNQGKNVNKTVGEYVKEAADCLGDIHKTVKKLGSILADARKTLTTDEYSEFVAVLTKSYHLTKNDIEAAIMVFNNKLDTRLFFSGVANSKILSLSEVDQRRLLSNEKFGIRKENGDVEKKAWADMTISEKDQLLGPKGGGIYGPDEQRHRSAGRKSILVFDNASFSDGTLTLRRGTTTAAIELGTLVQNLLSKEQLEKFNSELAELTEGELVEAK